MLRFAFGLIVFGLVFSFLTQNAVPAFGALVIAVLMGGFGARSKG